MLLKRTLLTTLAVFSLTSFPAVAQTASTTTPIVPAAPQAAKSSIAAILPKETVGVFLINTDNDRWKDLSQFALFPQNLSFPGFLLPVQRGIDFTKDVQPWLGDQVGVALLSGGNVLTISAIKDQTSAEKYVERVRSLRQKSAKETQYKGITILEFEAEKVSPKAPSSKPKISTLRQSKPTAPDEMPEVRVLRENLNESKTAIAILPGALVSASSTTAIQELIDTQAGNRLTDNPKFQRTLQNPRAARSLFIGYGKYIELVKTLDNYNRAQLDQLAKLAPNTPRPPRLDPERLDPLSAYYDTIDAYVWTEPTGVRSQFSLNLKQSAPQALVSQITTRNQILERLPEVNYAVSNSQNLALYWQLFTSTLESQPDWKKSLDQFRQWARSNAGVDDRDLLPWMNGEYTIFAYPTRKGGLPASRLDIAFGFMVQTSDRPAAEAAITKFNQFVLPRAPKELYQQRTIAGQPIVDWGVRNNGQSLNFLSYGWIDQNTALLLGGGGAFEDFNPKPKRNLTQSFNFKSAIAPFPDANLGYFYVNNGALLALINSAISPIVSGRQQSSDPYVNQVRETLGSIRSFSGSSRVTADQVQTEAFLSLAPRVKR